MKPAETRGTGKPPSEQAETAFHVADWPMHYLLAIDRFHVRNMTRVLAPYECAPLVWRVLSILSDKDGHSVSELAEVSVIERSNLSRLIDSMERDGLVYRSDREHDRRHTLVFITEQGRRKFSEPLKAVLAYYAQFLSGIRPAEMNAFMTTLRKIKRNVAGFDAAESIHEDDFE